MSLSKEKVVAFWAAHDKNNDGVLSADEVKGNLKSSDQCKMSEEAIEVIILSSKNDNQIMFNFMVYTEK